MTTHPFTPGNDNLPKVILASLDGARAEVYLHGAHVTSWIPAGDQERLYLSSASEFRDGAAIRGGVPVVFPQFSTWGPLPKHGFARNQAWELISLNEGSARFQLRDSDATRAIWPYAFLAELTVTVLDQRLMMELAITNQADEPFNFAAALHTYLRVDHIAATRIENLTGLKYFDATLKQEAVQTDDALTFSGEIDRVYFDAAKIVVRDGQRSLEVQNVGFPDGVIWNPGVELAAKLADLDPDGYQRFVCVEAAIFRTPITLQPYQTWRGGQTLTAEPHDEALGDNLRGEARVHDVLAAKPRHLIVAAAPTDRVREIIERLKIHDISQMPVLSDGKLIGLITESTLLAHLAAPGHTVEDTIAPMINRQVATVAPEQPAESLLNLFSGSQAVIVVEDDRVLGILTKLDLIEFLTVRVK
ncbi:MAG TPA: CBS domain-containing protein [Anaerolineae bacterium]|nr:CBS domain-containing protein [Anaerolineae bacterium]